MQIKYEFSKTFENRKLLGFHGVVIIYGAWMEYLHLISRYPAFLLTE